MDEFLCITLLSQDNESADDFKKRLIGFWSHMLRSFPDDYEKIYSEAVEFETSGVRQTRQYMIEVSVADLLLRELAGQKIGFADLDRDEIYSKYEASSSEWFQIEH